MAFHKARQRGSRPLGNGEAPADGQVRWNNRSGQAHKNIEVVFTYREVLGAVKCKLFVITLRWWAMTWYKNLRRNSFNSWEDLWHEFTTHFTGSRIQPKIVAFIEAIVLGKNKPLRDYIEIFNKKVWQNNEAVSRREKGFAPTLTWRKPIRSTAQGLSTSS